MPMLAGHQDFIFLIGLVHNNSKNRQEKKGSAVMPGVDFDGPPPKKNNSKKKLPAAHLRRRRTQEPHFFLRIPLPVLPLPLPNSSPSPSPCFPTQK
jgi:hypothetical protein